MLATTPRVLLVRGQVQDQVGIRNQFFGCADGKTVLRGIFPRLALVPDGRFTQGIGHVQTAIPEVQTLVETL